jgi:hypothetical protein
MHLYASACMPTINGSTIRQLADLAAWPARLVRPCSALLVGDAGLVSLAKLLETVTSRRSIGAESPEARDRYRKPQGLAAQEAAPPRI